MAKSPIAADVVQDVLGYRKAVSRSLELCWVGMGLPTGNVGTGIYRPSAWNPGTHFFQWVEYSRLKWWQMWYRMVWGKERLSQSLWKFGGWEWGI